MMPVQYQVGILAFMVIFGALLIWEGILEEFWGDEDERKWEKSIAGDILGNREQSDKRLDARGILFHYVFLAGIVATSFGYIANQVNIVATGDEHINFDHLYSWFAIVFTNMMVGYHAFIPVTKFMFRYYPDILEPAKDKPKSHDNEKLKEDDKLSIEILTTSFEYYPDSDDEATSTHPNEEQKEDK